jgi:cytochrome P450
MVPNQEAQRMYSVAPLVLRKALADIRVGQYTIPRGTAILIHVFAMHNTSANFERHAEFLPVPVLALSPVLSDL